MKILMAFSDWTHTEDRKKLNTYGGIGYYRIVKVAEQIKDHEVKVIGKEILHFGDTLEEQWDNLFKEYDVFWTNYFADPNVATACFYHAQKHGKKVVIDIDDNYLDVPQSNLLYERFKEGKKERAFLSTILSFADVITTSTLPLKQRIHSHIKKTQGLDKKVVIIPNYNDIKDWDFTPAEKHTDKIVIGYTGSNSHYDDLRLIMPSMSKLMNKYENVHFELIGSVPKDKVKEYFGGVGFTDSSLNRIGIQPATSIFKDYPKYLASMKWDIGLAPLVDSEFTRSKSHIKWLEYSMYNIPTIASRVYPYFMDIQGKKTIEDGVTGLLVKPNDWFESLEKMVLNKELRERLGKSAHAYVRDNLQYANTDISKVVNEMLK